MKKIQKIFEILNRHRQGAIGQRMEEVQGGILMESQGIMDWLLYFSLNWCHSTTLIHR